MTHPITRCSPVLIGALTLTVTVGAQTFASVPVERLRFTDTGGEGAAVVLLHVATGWGVSN